MKSLLTLLFAAGVLTLTGLFGYYYFSSENRGHSAERAQQAARETGTAVLDRGVAALVDVRLKSVFGLDDTRFLHTKLVDGTIYIYGLAPDDLDPDRVLAEATEVPGVKGVQLLTQPLPDELEGAIEP